MDLDNVSRDDWILSGVAVLLVIDLLFLPWFSVTVLGVSLTATATDAPDAWMGVLAVLATIGLIVDLGVERLSPGTALPNFRGSRTETRLALSAVTAFFLALKFLFQISHVGDLAFGFLGALVLTIALVYFALQARKAGAMTPGTI